MNVYESIVIIDASLSDEVIESSIQKLKDLITGEGGEVLKVDPWGRRKMAYELNKHQRGYYVLLLFRAPSSTIKKMEDLFKVFDPVVKAMTVRPEKKQREAALKALVEPKATETSQAETQEAGTQEETPAAETEEAPTTGEG